MTETNSLALCLSTKNDSTFVSDSFFDHSRNINGFSVSGPGLPPIENPFVKACIQKDVQKVHELLSKGANPNVVDKSSGLTPLMAGSLAGSMEIVKSLLKAGQMLTKLTTMAKML